jgi:hypothetical protein
MPLVNLNGQVFTSDSIAGLDGITATIRRSDGAGGAAFGFTGELTFYFEAYNIIRDLIITNPAPHLVKIPITIWTDECPEIPFVGFVEGANVSWCEISADGVACSAKAAIIDGSADAEKLACLKNTIIWDRLPKFGEQTISAGEDTFRQSRYLTYCIEYRPRALAEIVMIFYMIQRTILTPVVFVIALIISVINAMITAINTIPLVPNIPLIDFDGNDDTGAFQEMKNLLELANNLVTGCGAKHKTPFVHSYIQNVCDICGLTLNSSILSPGGYYHNLMRLDAPAYHTQPGASNPQIENSYNDQKPNLNAGQFLDEMRQNLNWDWWIEGSVLRIEPAGDVQGLVWVTQGDGTVIKSFCIETTDETIKAYGVYEYSQDSADAASNEVRLDWGGINDWNTPPNDVQRGALQRDLIYSAALFRKDNQGDSTLPIDKTFYNNSVAFPNLASWPRVMLLSKGVSSQPKLLMWDGTSPQDNARVLRWDAGNGKNDYNVPMWLRGSHPSGETLYQTSFEKTDNPRNSEVKLRNFTMEICLTCELLSLAPSATEVQVQVQGQTKAGKIESIAINYGKFTATITGKI